MGHDISGYTTKGGRNEIAYLRRGAGNDLAREIYKALNATEYDCGCSGCGETVFFTADRLTTAAAKIGDNPDLEQERQFLADCIKHGGESGVWIGFY